MKDNNNDDLVTFARKELKRAGLFDKNGDYGGMIGKFVMKIVRLWNQEGHSGMSHWKSLKVLEKVVNFQNLTPLTDDPDEWAVVGYNLWQSTRNYSCFSEDGGKTYYDISERKIPFWKFWIKKSKCGLRIYKTQEVKKKRKKINKKNEKGGEK